MIIIICDLQIVVPEHPLQNLQIMFWIFFANGPSGQFVLQNLQIVILNHFLENC